MGTEKNEGIEVGDRVKNCDPREHGAVKVVTEVGADYVGLRREGDVDAKRVTKVALASFHQKADSKRGYLLLPKEV